MWWQGDENCPDVVKLCWASIRRHCGKHKFIIITKDNYKDYVTLPEHITSKVDSGIITLTHLSDIIRVNLLAKYGGFWVDSTLFAADDIPEEIFSMEYYTIRRVQKRDIYNHVVSLSRWTGYCFAARDNNNLLFSFMAELLSEYWKNHDTLIHYVLIDYSVAIAFEEFPEFRKAWEKIPVNNVDVWKMYFTLADKEWDAEEYSDIVKTNRFFKLTWKDKKFNTRTASGKETFYGHLLADYNITPTE